MYGQQALAINELSGPQWQKPYYLDPSELLGRAVINNRSLFPEHWWVWVAVGALIGYAALLNVLGILAATYLNRECCMRPPCPSAPSPFGDLSKHACLPQALL